MVRYQQILEKNGSLFLFVFLLGQRLLVLSSAAAFYGSSALEGLSSNSKENEEHEFLKVKSDLNSLNNNKVDSKHVSDNDQIQDLVQLILQEEKLMESAQNKRSLVKRFVKFLRSAYPLEMPTWSETVQNGVQRARGPRKKRFHIKNRHRKQQNDKDKTEPKMHTGKCGCKMTTECLETDEPDKFRMFFSSPPLCRMSSTSNPLDDLPPTDMCGHSCICHISDPPTTDNDKEIFVGHRKSTERGLGLM